jgi:hypothetical protein
MSDEKAIDVLVAEGIVTKAEVERVKAKHRAMLDQTVPFGNGARLKPLNRTPNHAVGECYKPYSTLNIHDPDNQYVWADELDRKKLLWNSITIGGAALFSVGFLVGIYCLVLLGLLL